LTISEQTLTTAQKNQVAANLGIARSTLRDVPFAVGVSDWTLSNGVYTANFLSDYITSSCKVILTYEPTLENARAYINAAKKTGGGGLTFTTSTIPVGTVTGTAYVFDNDDNKVPTLIENTVTPIANGGTGQSSLAGAQQALGITALNTQIAKQTAQTFVPNCPTNCSVWNNGCYYQKAGNVVTLYMGFKMENVTQTGFQGRFTITHNLPDGIKPVYALTVFGDNGEANGFSSASITATTITVYPQKTGTTYFAGVVTYVV
jgi:hypothetical protein